MKDKYYFYMEWIYQQLNGGINETVPCKRMYMVKGHHSLFKKSEVLGYAAIDEIGIYYDELLDLLYSNDYSDMQRKGICIQLMLHELSHLSQNYTYALPDEFEMSNDLNVVDYMILHDDDIRTKCGEYDLDFIDSLIMNNLERYMSTHNEIPTYRKILNYAERIETYLESRLKSEIPDFVKNFQLRYFTTTGKYIYEIIKDGIRLSNKHIGTALNFIIHNSMKEQKAGEYQKLHMDQNSLYLDILPNSLNPQVQQKNQMTVPTLRLDE